MKPQISRKFLLLDFGHPMTVDAVKLIKKSLQNSVSLLAAFDCNFSYFEFGIKVMNSQFDVVESTTNLSKKFNVIIQKIDILDNIPEINEKITVLDYKRILKNFFETLLQKYVSNKKNMHSDLMEIKSKVFILTKKRASLLSDILVDIISKISKSHENGKCLLKTVNVIQLMKSSEEVKIVDIHKENNLVNKTTCSENSHNLDCLMKDWLLRSDDGKQRVRISLLKEIDLTVNCDIDECIVTRHDNSFLSQFDLHENLGNKLNDSPVFHDNTNSVQYLEILYRIPVSGLCPTFVFGAPRRIRAARNDSLYPNEPQTNAQIFRALCQQLFLTKQGLLTQSNFQFQTNEVSTFHFITSDGHSLLLNNVSPCELLLPQHLETIVKRNYPSDDDANEIIQTVLRRVEFLEKYSPFEFSSGIYEYLKSNLMRAAEKFSFLGNIDPLFKSRNNFPFDKITKKGKFNILKKDNGTKINNIKMEKTYVKKSPHPKKKQKINLELEYKNTHPALLPKELVAKFNKNDKPTFYADDVTDLKSELIKPLNF